MGIEMSPGVETRPMEAKESEFTRVGLLFKEARERRGMTVKQASQALHIRQLYISSIETGNLSALPGYAYKVGFIKTYASFLGLDPVQLLRDLGLYEETPPTYSSFTYSIPLDQQKKPSLKIVLAATTLLFIAGGTLYVANNRAYLPEGGSVPTIPSQSPTLERGQPSDQKDRDQTEGAEPSVSHRPAASDPISSGTNPSVPNTPGQTPQSPASLVPAPLPQGTSKPESTPSDRVGEEDTTITIKAVKDSWVQVTNETGKAVFVRLMRAGETYTLPATGVYRLNTGNGAGIKLLLGDKSTPSLGKDGQVMRGISLDVNHIKALIEE
jgi:cytoskeleton protein RodZ